LQKKFTRKTRTSSSISRYCSSCVDDARYCLPVEVHCQTTCSTTGNVLHVLLQTTDCIHECRKQFRRPTAVLYNWSWVCRFFSFNREDGWFAEQHRAGKQSAEKLAHMMGLSVAELSPKTISGSDRFYGLRNRNKRIGWVFRTKWKYQEIIYLSIIIVVRKNIFFVVATNQEMIFPAGILLYLIWHVCKILRAYCNLYLFKRNVL